MKSIVKIYNKLETLNARLEDSIKKLSSGNGDEEVNSAYIVMEFDAAMSIIEDVLIDLDNISKEPGMPTKMTIKQINNLMDELLEELKLTTKNHQSEAPYSEETKKIVMEIERLRKRRNKLYENCR